MVGQKAGKSVYLLLFLFVVIAANSPMLFGGDLFSRKEKIKASVLPRLYLLSSEPNSTEVFAVDIDFAPTDKSHIVIATHGWYEDKVWPENLAFAIKCKVDNKKWLCGWYDWRRQAKVINPTDAAKFGRDIAGIQLGAKILQVSTKPKHIHLIGHSAGSWVISEAAKIIATQTNATIHLTFLDAYVPPFWDEKVLGDFGKGSNVTYWADHYFTKDITLKTTEEALTGAHNVDLTDVTPGINDHEFPRYWYHATVIGQYEKGKKYEGKELFCSTEKIEYGFARSLEAGEGNWQKSRELAVGNEPVKIEKPRMSLELGIGERFKKGSK